MTGTNPNMCVCVNIVCVCRHTGNITSATSLSTSTFQPSFHQENALFTTSRNGRDIVLAIVLRLRQLLLLNLSHAQRGPLLGAAPQAKTRPRETRCSPHTPPTLPSCPLLGRLPLSMLATRLPLSMLPRQLR